MRNATFHGDCVEKLSNPDNRLLLPFLYLDVPSTDRFAIDKSGRFAYIGRQRFKELKCLIDDLDYFRRYHQVAVRGVTGTGKSHLLAAMAFTLHREGKQVVYIPDQKDFLEKPVEVLRNAFAIAFLPPEGGFISELFEILTFQCVQDFLEFAKKWAIKSRMYFVIDEMTASNVGHLGNTSYGINQTRALRILMEMAANHYVVQTGSGNNLLGFQESYEVRNWKFMDLNRGFSKVGS